MIWPLPGLYHMLKQLREMEISEIPLPRHCERSVAIHATVVRDHGSPRFARDDETGMFVISDSLRVPNA
jgi:hypothetical protein